MDRWFGIVAELDRASGCLFESIVIGKVREDGIDRTDIGASAAAITRWRAYWIS